MRADKPRLKARRATGEPAKSVKARVGAAKVQGAARHTGLVEVRKDSGSHVVFNRGPLFQNTALAFLDEEDTQSVVDELRKGLKAQAINDLSQSLAVTKEGLYSALGVKRSTVEQRIAKKETLNSAEGDAVYRAARVFKRAVEVLEDQESGKAWLCRRIRSLGGVTPLSLLDTQAGYELVMQTLGRIEQGIPS